MGFLFRVPPPPSGSGYFAGGYKNPAPAGVTSAISALDFGAETTRVVSASITTAKQDLVGVNSSTKGYFAGGGNTTAISSLVFTGETSTTITATLSISRNDSAGVNSSLAGYFMGGSDGGGNPLATADKLTFSTETIAALGTKLSDGARYGLAGVNSSTVGYCGGGWAGSTVNWIDGIIFSTDATTNPSATLATSRRYLAGYNSSTRGYWAGGQLQSGSSSTEIDGIDFGTVTAINPTAALTQARFAPFGVNSSAKGYIAGGGTTAGSIDGFTFATETNAALVATMAVDKYNGGSAQSGTL